MATFTNYATLSYNGVTTDSNIVTGELLETLSAAKTAVPDSYSAGSAVTYVVSMVNSGTAALTGLTVTDDLGGYEYGGATVYPLAYTDGSVRYYVNGVLQAAPTVTAGPPLVINGINVPAGGNAIIVYEASVTNYAPLGAEATVTNNAVISGTGLSASVTATEEIGAEPRLRLNITKAISPSAVTENGQLTYTFVIENTGSIAATAADNVIMTDTFDPILDPITVSFNGTAWTAGINYTYDTTTGVFETQAGEITVPAATYTQNADGTWAVQPGTATLVITGTV